MKKVVFGLLIVSSAGLNATRFMIDRLEAVIFGEEDTVIVIKSDADRLTLNGQPRTVDDVILESLMYQEAKKFKIDPDEAAVNRYLEEVQRDNNLSAAEIKAMFGAAGYTYAEGKEQLAKSFAVSSIMDFKVRSRLVVLDRDIQAYYAANPVEREAAYCLQHAVIPYDTTVDRSEQRAALARQVKANKEIKGAQWSQSFWVNKSDMDAAKQFIFSMKPNDISQPQETTEGFELFKLVEARPQGVVPLEDRRNEIVEAIRKPRYEELVENYKKELYEASSIIRF